MPTGYTSDLYEGKDVDFPDFVMTCARAFGATITMRDEPLDAPIPDEFPPSSYNQQRLAEARQRLAEVRAWTDEDAEAAARGSHEANHAAWERSVQEKNERQARYTAMLAKVQAWLPPTSEHESLKKFMAEQLTESIRCDCTTWDPPTAMSGAEFRAAQEQKALRDIDYHTAEHVKEVERAAERTEWVRALRASLGLPSASR